ncbi:HIT domain-containing protein [Cellulomonas sp. ACRRI]|uniref:HIT domain-containing protein n=1 Tax=Cellulomonas sp. ACRRI TaxID=2918188 RepID=UPI001EF3386B|nr:HIT domain-containing protein [Cellulomonas sp. ACRRI]MCG7284443.1 HIT domain-containing protein [Cellulomonas sp. ACRRI]
MLQDEAIVASMDVDPGADGHLLVAPGRHSADPFSIPAEDLGRHHARVGAVSPWHGSGR